LWYPNLVLAEYGTWRGRERWSAMAKKREEEEESWKEGRTGWL
jgi:hypothetical protein